MRPEFGRQQIKMPPQELEVPARSVWSSISGWLFQTPFGVWCLACTLWAMALWFGPHPSYGLNPTSRHADLIWFWLNAGGLLLGLSLASGIIGRLIAQQPGAWIVSAGIPTLTLAAFVLSYVIDFHLLGEGRPIKAPTGTPASAFSHPWCKAWTTGDEECVRDGSETKCTMGRAKQGSVICTEVEAPYWCLLWGNGCRVESRVRHVVNLTREIDGVPVDPCMPGLVTREKIGCLQAVFSTRFEERWDHD